LAFLEADWIGTLFGFHMNTMTLLWESSLDEDKKKIVADRIKTLLDDTTAVADAAIEHQERLETAYDEVERLVDELSGLSDGGKKC
jgi:hypothetical protein